MSKNNKKTPQKTIKKSYKNHGYDYTIQFNNMIQYDEIQKQLSVITNLCEDY